MVYHARFWQDNPCKMLDTLGYEFHTAPGDSGVGLHFDAYRPGLREDGPGAMESWITVKRPSGRMPHHAAVG
mgnify:CR=1 FL=1